MTITLNYPADIEERLRSASPDLETVIGQAAAVALYREGHLSRFDFARTVGMEQPEADDLLRSYGEEDYTQTVEEVEQDVETLRKYLAEHRR